MAAEKEKTLFREHLHIDNGGLTVSIDEYGNISLSVGFYGYSDTTLMLSNQGINDKKKGMLLERLIEALSTAKDAYDHNRFTDQDAD